MVRIRKIMLFVMLLTILLTFSIQMVASQPWPGHGKDIVNFKDGCRPPQESGNYIVFMPEVPPGYPHEWEGGPCCPSNNYLPGQTYSLPNACCNPPDYVEPGPGNHCLCFMLRMEL